MSNQAKAVTQEIHSPTAIHRESDIRGWIARKESVCPYAPGLAKFVQLPEITRVDTEHLDFLAKILQEFYDAKENGKRVGRWMLMPHREWQSHDEAHAYSERVFWLLNAAYFSLIRDEKSLKLALQQKLPGYSRGHKADILNPVVGRLPNIKSNIIPARSLFYSALSPLYKSKQFYRYSPHCIMPLVYASEFEELKRKHPQVTKSVCYEMAVGGLYEVFGDQLGIDEDLFRKELPVWGAIIDRIAEIYRGSVLKSDEVKGCPASNLGLFRQCSRQMVSLFYDKYADKLAVLKDIKRQTNANAKQIISASFAGSGHYTIPDYL